MSKQYARNAYILHAHWLIIRGLSMRYVHHRRCFHWCRRCRISTVYPCCYGEKWGYTTCQFSIYQPKHQHRKHPQKTRVRFADTRSGIIRTAATHTIRMQLTIGTLYNIWITVYNFLFQKLCKTQTLFVSKKAVPT